MTGCLQFCQRPRVAAAVRSLAFTGAPGQQRHRLWTGKREGASRRTMRIKYYTGQPMDRLVLRVAPE